MAIILPGTGHLLLQRADRALTFLFFIIILGWVSFRLTTPEHNFLGRYAFGLFVYALSIIDAYRLARIRYEVWRHRAR
jgi:hypothetical protein